MVSYFKTQWWRLLFGTIALVLCFVFLFQPAGDSSTLEGLDQDLSNSMTAVAWLVNALVWYFCSFADWSHKRIETMNKRIEKLEEHCITDLDPTTPGNYIARRRCGPDKDVPYPEEETKDETHS